MWFRKDYFIDYFFFIDYFISLLHFDVIFADYFYVSTPLIDDYFISADYFLFAIISFLTLVFFIIISFRRKAAFFRHIFAALMRFLFRRLRGEDIMIISLMMLLTIFMIFSDAFSSPYVASFLRYM